MKKLFHKITRLSLIGAVIFSLAYCNKKKDKEPEEPATTFDKHALLVNMADNVILPSYNSFKNILDSLTVAYSTFTLSGLQTDFQIVKQKFNSAYLKYQRMDLFEFGPGESIALRTNCNIFPTHQPSINSNISDGNYDLEAGSNFDAKGLPALDYLFYGKDQTEADIIQLFNSSANRKKYAGDLLNNMSLKTNSVINSWTTYRETFINSLGTDVSSSIGFLVNQVNYQLDYLKNAKIGTPLGKKTLGIPVPESCEAYYGGQSVQYAIETLNLIENTYLGRNISGSNGKGFDDYLDHLNAQYNGGSLNQAINNQFAVAKIKLSALANPLSTQVTTNATAVDAAYAELVKLLVLLKTDMPSSLGVIITYQDGDGD